MEQLIRRLILCLSIAASSCIFTNKAFATHLAGSDISYTCLGGNTYRVELTFYRDCRGVSLWPNGVTIEFKAPGCATQFNYTLLLNPGSGQEISYPCPGLTTACDDPNSLNPGIQEYRYSGVVTLPALCTNWEMSWSYCCRNCDITTMVIPPNCAVPGNNAGMFIDATLDNLNFPCNSSPYFTNNPIVFVCIGQNFTYNHGAVDPDGDSLVYSLVNPMKDSVSSIPFIPPYSATNPITSSPDSISIDPMTGDIVMLATQQETGVLSVLVEEYRDGVLIGHVVRDMEIYVRPCNNNIPTATGMNGTAVHDTVVCPGDSICFDIFSNDLDVGQIVTMTWNQQITNATFTVSGFPYPTGHFCWTPGVNDISTIPHQFVVNVVDNNCPFNGYQSYAFTILVGSPLININVTNISCSGLTDGSIAVNPVNPGGFSYIWSPGGSTSSSISGLGAGNYDVTVYDSTTGCQATFPNTIINPPPLADTAFSLTGTCTSSNDGSALAIASGGTPPYSYSWNTTPVTNNDTATSLSAGTYIVTVTDSRGCSTTDTVTVSTSSSALNINATGDTVLCYTDTTGIATVSVSGGTPGYTYVWNTTPVQTGQTATGLSPGIQYIVTIVDSAGCSASDTASISSPPLIVVTGHAVPASCGNSDGIAFVTVAGGVSPYTYSWSPVAGTDDSLLNVPPGLYDITVTDSNLCLMDWNVLVGSQTISSTANGIAPIGCSGDSNAIAVATATGGIPPYVFVWNTVPAQTNDTATGLSAGLYIVTITDSTTCYTVDTVNIPNLPTLNVSITTVNANCAGDSSGTATANVSGGMGPYTYLWSPYGGIGSMADSLIAGFYTVTVTDAAGCIVNASDSVRQDVLITIVVDSVVTPHCNGANTGAIYLSVGGGSGNYGYAWNPGSFTTQDIVGINEGIYTVTVTDLSGCSQPQSITVTQPPPVSVNAGADAAICAGATITLNATVPVAGITGVWSSLTVPIAQFSDPTDPHSIVFNVPPGNHFLIWTVTDTNGCVNSDQISLFNFNLSAGPDFTVCGLPQIQLMADDPQPWGLSGAWTAPPNISFTDDTLYNTTINVSSYEVDTLTWTVSGSACITSDYVVVTTLEPPIAEAGDSSLVCVNNGTLSAVVSGPGAGFWTEWVPTSAVFADSLSETTEVTNLQPGQTVFVWVMTNGVCIAADTVFIDYDPSCELELPTGFSPNGDLYNDGYFIRGIDAYPLNYFYVFNRWGNEVYSTEDYSNNSMWMGTANDGSELPEGTYFVILVIKNSEIKKNTFVDLRRYSGK